MKTIALTFALALFSMAAMVAAQSAENKSAGGPTKVTGAPIKTASGLEYWDIKAGTGAEAKPGHKVKVDYTGWLTNGKKFDSSVGTGRPFQFMLGASQVIKGWDEGVAGMKVGGKRQLKIPADLAYGKKGAAGVIPPDATLIFDVQLLDVD
jgi:FKBP-type peptidyl-prolyl cis-trans isomerase